MHTEANQDRNRAIIDSTQTFVIIATDRDGTITDWNAGAARVLGWSEDEMIGQPIDRIFTPEDRAGGRAATEMRLAVQNGRANDDRWHVRKDGSRFWASGEMTPLRLGGASEHSGFVKVLRDATARVQAQQALAAQREQLTQMFEQAPTFMALLRGPEHRFELCNPGYQKLVGHRDVVGRTVAEALPEVVGQGFVDLLDKVYSTGVPFVATGLEIALQMTDGGPFETRYLDFVYQPLRDSDGKVTGIFVEGADVSARVAAETALHQSENLYRALFDSIDEGFCIIEFFDGPHGPLSDYIHVEANAAYARHAGIPNVVGQKLREMVGEEADAWVERYGGVLRTGQQIRFQQELVATGRHLELSAVRIEPPERKQVAVLFQDITARKQAEAALRRSEEQFRVFAQTVPNHVWAAHPTGELYWFNEQVYAYAGADAGSLDGHEWGRIVHPDDLEPAAQLWAEALQSGKIYEIEFRIRRADGAYRWFLVRASPVRAADGEIVSWIGTNTDIENSRRQTAELAVLNARLEQLVDERTGELMAAEETLRQSQKMEAVGQLTGGLAHDFNNLLAGISGSLELFDKRVAQGRIEEATRYVTAAQGAVRRATALTHRLLAFSRRQTLDPRPTDLNRLVTGMDDLIRRTVGPEIKVEVVAAAGLWPSLVDPNQLENALLNLCINARDAMPEGGRLTIETANRWLDERAAREREIPPGQYISMCVSDSGTGMTDEVKQRAFDPFFTTKPIGQGTGLGLSMIYGFARQSGGQVRIYSEVGEGTMVCIYLPRHLGADLPEEASASPVASPESGKGETVLVVDDEVLVRMLVVEVLEEMGYTVIEADDGASGLKILQSDARIDLLVTDVGLPNGMNGRQMADAARVSRPDLKVLFITGYAENAVVGHGHLDHGMHVLTKPFALEALAARINELVAKS
jgi:PAS domain S-box-containing protein